MKDKNCRKKVVASALVIGAMASGTAMASNQMVNATSNDNGQSESSETHKKPELNEEKKAEIKAKLDAMTEEEKKEWIESHKPKDGERPEHGKNRGKPADLTDEEWEQKKAELKEKLDAMTEEEKKEWLVSHRHKKGNRAEGSQAELPAEE